MDKQIKEDLELIKESVLANVQAEAIYLFGSHVYGTPNKDSDIDIYVVVPNDTENMAKLYGAILGSISSKKKFVLVDLQTEYSGVFHRRKNAPTLERTIAQKGMILYGGL